MRVSLDIEFGVISDLRQNLLAKIYSFIRLLSSILNLIVQERNLKYNSAISVCITSSLVLLMWILVVKAILGIWIAQMNTVSWNTTIEAGHKQLTLKLKERYTKGRQSPTRLKANGMTVYRLSILRLEKKRLLGSRSLILRIMNLCTEWQDKWFRWITSRNNLRRWSHPQILDEDQIRELWRMDRWN